MKKTVYIIMVLILVSLTAACGNKSDKIQIPVEVVADIAEYKVIRGENCTDEEKKATVELHQALYKVFDSIGIGTDYSKGTKEILVGNTNRSESVEAIKDLKYNDYIIKKVGNKIIVAGGSASALETAIDVFKARLIYADTQTVKIPTDDGFLFKGTYASEILTVEGIDISEFQIYNKSLLENTAIAEKINGTFGVEFPIAKEIKDSGHYIIIDGSDLVADRYSISIENGNLTVKGSANSVSAAVEALTNEYLKDIDPKKYDLTKKDDLKGTTGKKDIYTKDQLMKVLSDVYADPDKVIVGEEIEGGKNADIIDKYINNFMTHTGQKPGIIGVDLGCYGVDLVTTNETRWSSYICDIVDYCAEGGIVTISSHFANPSGNYGDSAKVRGSLVTNYTLENLEKAFTDIITEGTALNTAFKAELDANAKFLAGLRDSGVPVIWRPLHEANGDWFWYCTVQSGKVLDSSFVINIWKYIHDYFTNEYKLDNLIWCYAPNISENSIDIKKSPMNVMYLYPGDEYCDIVGVDWYSSGALEITVSESYPKLISESGKIGAVTEFGPNNNILAETFDKQPELYSCMDLYGDLYEVSKNEISMAYILLWSGKHSAQVLGNGIEFMNTDMTLGQTDVKALFDALK